MSIFKDNSSNTTKHSFKEKHIKEILKRYDNDLKNSKKIMKPFTEIAKDIIGKDSPIAFEHKTHLSQNMYYDLKSRIGIPIKKEVKSNDVTKKIEEEDIVTIKQTKKSTIVSLCIGYNQSLQVAIELLRSQGSYLNPHSPVDLAYTMLLTECRGMNIDECNKLLEEMNIKETDRLGSYTRSLSSNKKNASL